MPSKSKTKGNAGERELIIHLSEIFGGSFVRVPNSGAFVGGKHAHRRQVLSKTQDRTFRGDIIPPDHLPKLIIESKAYKDFRFHQLMKPGECPLLDDWIKQTLDIVDPNDQWFVTFKINRIGWYVCVPEASCDGCLFTNYCVYNSPHGATRITDMLEFFRANHELIAKRAA